MGLALLLTAVPIGAGWFEDAPINACRRLRATGLEPPVGWTRRLQWGYTGMFVALSGSIVIRAWTG